MKLQATRGAQYTLSTDFNFNYQNWVVDSVDGAKKTLGSTVANSSDPAEPLLTGPVANTVVFDGINIFPAEIERKTMLRALALVGWYLDTYRQVLGSPSV